MTQKSLPWALGCCPRAQTLAGSYGFVFKYAKPTYEARSPCVAPFKTSRPKWVALKTLFALKIGASARAHPECGSGSHDLLRSYDLLSVANAKKMVALDKIMRACQINKPLLQWSPPFASLHQTDLTTCQQAEALQDAPLWLASRSPLEGTSCFYAKWPASPQLKQRPADCSSALFLRC